MQTGCTARRPCAPQDLLPAEEQGWPVTALQIKGTTAEQLTGHSP